MLMLAYDLGVVMLPSDGTQAPDALLTQIRVNVEGVRQMAADLRQSLERDYRTQVPVVDDAMQNGATIGGQIVGLPFVGLQNVYSQRIGETLNTLLNIDKGSQALAQAADVIATKYGQADGFAHATASDVNEILVAPPPPPADIPAQKGAVQAQ